MWDQTYRWRALKTWFHKIVWLVFALNDWRIWLKMQIRWRLVVKHSDHFPRCVQKKLKQGMPTSRLSLKPIKDDVGAFEKTILSQLLTRTLNSTFLEHRDKQVALIFSLIAPICEPFTFRFVYVFEILLFWIKTRFTIFVDWDSEFWTHMNIRIYNSDTFLKKAFFQSMRDFH